MGGENPRELVQWNGPVAPSVERGAKMRHGFIAGPGHAEREAEVVLRFAVAGVDGDRLAKVLEGRPYVAA